MIEVSKMEEHSRIILEEYAMTHKSAKAQRIGWLVEMSYDLSYEGTDDDAIFLESAIETERNPERKKALEDLDDFLFGW